MNKVIKFIIWLIIEVGSIIGIILLMRDNASIGFAFILPVVGLCFLPEILKEG